MRIRLKMISARHVMSNNEPAVQSIIRLYFVFRKGDIRLSAYRYSIYSENFPWFYAYGYGISMKLCKFSFCAIK